MEVHPMRALTDTLLLTRRALRETIRQPANEAVNAFIPLFFYMVTVGGLGEVASQAFGVEDYKGFQLPVAILQGAASVASGAGLAMTLDIQSGYFEKLMLTSTPRPAIVLGRMLADAVKAVILTIVIVALALAYGSGFETGPLGMLVLVAGAGLFALGYSGIGMAIALKTGSPQAANAGFIIFFPLLFLAPDRCVRRLARRGRERQPGHLHPRRPACAHHRRLGYQRHHVGHGGDPRHLRLHLLPHHDGPPRPRRLTRRTQRTRRKSRKGTKRQRVPKAIESYTRRATGRYALH